MIPSKKAKPTRYYDRYYIWGVILAVAAAHTTLLIFLYSPEIEDEGLTFFDGIIPCSMKRQMIQSLKRIGDEEPPK